jgi:hypothetical protein
MRTLSSLVLLVLSTTRVAAAQSTRPHQWAQLFATASEAIDLDTATVQRADGLRRVWLRWDLDRSGPVFLAQYQLEHREVDCARELTRVLAVETHGARPSLTPDGVSPPAASRPPDTVSSSDSVWHVVSSGSLADIVVKAVCRWREAGA